MGVAVQAMVDSEVSGVLFTCNPVSGDPSMVAVNASWGLGIGVVGGELTPDDFLVSKITGEVVQAHREHEAHRVRPRPCGARHGPPGRARPSGATSPAWATRSSPRSSRSPGASSATTVVIRTWSGRSPVRTRCRSLCSSCRRVR